MCSAICAAAGGRLPVPSRDSMDELAAAAAVEPSSMEVDHDQATLANGDAGSPADVNMNSVAGEDTHDSQRAEASDRPSAGKRRPHIHLLLQYLTRATSSTKLVSM